MRNIIVLSYAFKMKQDYLRASYFDQKYLPSEQSERGRYELIQVTYNCTEIILSLLKAYDQILVTPFTFISLMKSL